MRMIIPGLRERRAVDGQLTTFFRTDAGGRVVDSWAVRLASYRADRAPQKDEG